MVEQGAAREAAGILGDELGIGPLDFRDRGVVACGDDGDLLRQCPLHSETDHFCGSAANYAKRTSRHSADVKQISCAHHSMTINGWGGVK